MTTTSPIIHLVQHAQEAYRHSGRPVHPVRAAQGLNEGLAAIGMGGPPELGHVGSADEGR